MTAERQMNFHFEMNKVTQIFIYIQNTTFFTYIVKEKRQCVFKVAVITLTIMLKVNNKKKLFLKKLL